MDLMTTACYITAAQSGGSNAFIKYSFLMVKKGSWTVKFEEFVPKEQITELIMSCRLKKLVLEDFLNFHVVF